MSGVYWEMSVELTDAEERICKRLKRVGRLFVFLRRHRHELFDDEFQQELMAMYSSVPRGTLPLPAAMLAMVTLLQAYEKKSDAAAVEEAVFDARWQMVLGCLGAERPPFSQGVLVDFRSRLIEHDMDRRLVERTVELARATGEFGHKALRLALDSAPLWGAGRVEDTFNLIGHAMEVVVECASVVAGLKPEEVRQRAGTELLGGSSIKARLDIDWDDKQQQQDALQRLLADVAALRKWVGQNLADASDTPPLKDALELLARVVKQDLEPDPNDKNRSRKRQGVASDRRISVTDAEMRHGRKSSSRVINGYKRHVAVDLDSGLILATTVRPANEREHLADGRLRQDVERLGEVAELHIDRGYLSAAWVDDLRKEGKPVLSKPWAGRNTGRYTKGDFRFDFDAKMATCPAGSTAAIRAGKPGKPSKVTYPTSVCRACSLRDQCIPRDQRRGRQLALHRAEVLLQQLRDAKRTTAGRAKLRQRVTVEHRLAHLTRRQGRQARYVGTRKNTLDARRVAAVENLHCVARMMQAA